MRSLLAATTGGSKDRPPSSITTKTTASTAGTESEGEEEEEEGISEDTDLPGDLEETVRAISLSGAAKEGAESLSLSPEFARGIDGATASVVLTDPATAAKRGMWLATTMARATEEFTTTGIAPKMTPRFIACEKGDVAKGAERWLKTLKWRRDVGANYLLRCPHPDFDVIKRGYPQYIHLTDLHGRPVCWEKLGKIDLPLMKKHGVTLKSLLFHYMTVSEFLWEYICPDDSGKSVTVLDLEGIKLKHLTGDVLTFIRSANGFYGQHYPERAAHILVLNAPSSFSMMWKMVQRFVDPVTAKKIIVCKKKDVPATLQKYIPAENIPSEYGGKCKIPLGQSPEEELLRSLMLELNLRAGGR